MRETDANAKADANIQPEANASPAALIPIIFCARDSVYTSAVLQHLLKESNIQVKAVVLSTRVKRINASLPGDAWAIVATSGWRYFFYITLVTAIFALLSPLLGLPSVARQARAAGIPVYKTNDINTSASRAFLDAQVSEASRGPLQSVLFTAMFNQKLGSALLANDDLFFINLHPGRLPGYRGVDPVLEMLRQRQSTLAVVLHRTESELDCGDILAERELPVDAGRSLLWHQRRLFELGAEQFCRWLSDNDGSPWHEVDVQSQSGHARYYGWPEKNNVAAIETLIDRQDIAQLLKTDR